MLIVKQSFNKIKILGFLAIVMLVILTRVHGLSSLSHLYDFTLPALFVAGVYLRNYLVALTIIVLAVAIDNYAIINQGISANCITPAYSVLLLSYFFMYFSGHYLHSLAIDSRQQLMRVSFIIVIASSIQWLMATVSYYAFTESIWVNFATYALKWAPIELAYIFSWMLAIIAVVTFVRYFTWHVRSVGSCIE